MSYEQHTSRAPQTERDLHEPPRLPDEPIAIGIIGAVVAAAMVFGGLAVLFASDAP